MSATMSKRSFLSEHPVEIIKRSQLIFETIVDAIAKKMKCKLFWKKRLSLELFELNSNKNDSNCAFLIKLEKLLLKFYSLVPSTKIVN